MQDFGIWLPAIVGVIVLLFLLKLAVRKVGCNCHQCGERMAFWDEMDEDDQEEILSYYRQYEDRELDTTAVFLCRKCGYVYDDFSGEKRSMGGDTASFCKVCRAFHVDYIGQYVGTRDHREFREENPELINKTRCLTCEGGPYSGGDCLQCDAPFKVFGCRKCKTLYAWVPMLSKKFKYLVPLTEENVLKVGPANWAL